MKKADTNKPAATMYPKSRRTVAESKSVLKQSKNKKLSKDKLPVIKKRQVQGLCNIYPDVRRAGNLSPLLLPLG